MTEARTDGRPEATDESSGAPTTVAAEFMLQNGGPGPDPLTLSELDAVMAVLLFHRDHFSGNCRRQALRMARQLDAFRARDVAVVSVLPESKARAAAWAEARETPLPTLADPDGEVADMYDQPTRFGRLGRRIDLIGRLPLVVLVDLRDDPAELWRYAGESAADWPDIDVLLREVEKFA